MDSKMNGTQSPISRACHPPQGFPFLKQSGLNAVFLLLVRASLLVEGLTNWVREMGADSRT